MAGENVSKYRNLKAARRILKKIYPEFYAAYEDDPANAYFVAWEAIDRLGYSLSQKQKSMIVCSALSAAMVDIKDASEIHPYSMGGFDLWSVMSAHAHNSIWAAERLSGLEEDSLKIPNWVGGADYEGILE